VVLRIAAIGDVGVVGGGRGRARSEGYDAAFAPMALKRWRDQADLLVVSVHWGSMYVDFPVPRVHRRRAA
jgi:poly-gamma-glutamate capsule biosynthesis protein CapA/YwtB (metallophosphatase superfamily)